MPIKIDFVSNVSRFVRGTKDAEKALDDVADSLDDMVKDGDTAERQLERNFSEIADAAKKADKQIDNIGDDSRKSFGKASGATSEFKDEAKSNFSEVTSSFDGSMSSIQDLAQGTLGGLAATDLPGVGIAAGIAAAGIGLIASGLQAAEDKRLELEERANDLAQAYIEAGGSVLDSLTVADRATDILTDPARRKEADELSKLLGGDLSLAVRALAGEEGALTEVQTRAAAAQEKLNDMSSQQKANTGKRKTDLSEEADEMQKLVDKTADLTTVQENAATTAQVQSDVLYDLINNTRGATVQVDKFGNELYTLPDGKQVVVKADTRRATTNVDEFKGDVDSIKGKTVTVNVTAETSGAMTAAQRLKDYLARGVNIPVTLTQQNGRRWV